MDKEKARRPEHEHDRRKEPKPPPTHKEEHELEEQEGHAAQVWRSIGAEPPATPEDAAALAVERKQGGEPVDAGLAATVAAQTGRDVSHARVHGDPLSRMATAAMGARAFAYGDDIFLGPGESAADAELMAHELAHVAQQRQAPQPKIAIGGSNSAAEVHADGVAAAVTRGAAPTQLLVDAGPLAAGQMLLSQFKPLLHAQITSVVEQELGKLGATAGCPYIERYFTKYGASAGAGETLIRHWIPAAAQAQRASDLIPLVLVRVREGVRAWKASGRLPPELAAVDPELATPTRSLAQLETELGPGSPVPSNIASRMSSVLGVDLSGVRVHTGPVAAAKASEVGAAAFAIGGNVVMGKAAPPAGTFAGDALLAHELAHTAQQRDAARDPVARLMPIGDEDQAAEVNANQVALAKLGNFAGALGDVMRTGLQLQRCPEPAMEELSRGDYLASREMDIIYDAAKHIREMPFATYDPDVRWTQDGEKKFADALASLVIERPRGDTLESLVRPDQLGVLVDRARVITKEPNTGASTEKGPDGYFPGLGVEVGNSLVRRAAESLQREVPRYAQARIKAGREPNPVDVPVSHPIDPMVVTALSSGVVTVDAGLFSRRHPELAGQKAVLQTRKVELKPEGGTGVWHRLVSPKDATLEEIAHQLLGSSTEAFRIQNAHPLYGIDPDTRHQTYVDPDHNAGNALLGAGGELADEVALAQAGKASGQARSRDLVLEQMRLTATMLKGSVRDAAHWFGLGERVDAEAKRVDARATKLTDSSDGDVAKWDAQTSKQAEIISRAARGLEIDHLRLQTYMMQFGGDPTKDPGGFALPDEYRQALRGDAELWVAAVANSSLVGVAERSLLAAAQSSSTLEIEILERGLSVPQEAAFASKDSDNVKGDFNAGTIGDREMDIRKRMGKARAQMLADPTKVDVKGTQAANEESRDLIFESQVVLQASSLDAAWKALDDSDGWMSKVTFDSDDLRELKTEGKRYYAQWQGVYALIQKGEKVKARKQFEDICVNKAFQDYLKRVNELLKKVQKHHLIATLIAMVIITVVSMGAGAVLSSALGGTAVTVAGAEVVVGGIGVARSTAAIAGFVAEVATFTFLSNRAFSKDHSVGALATDFGKNIVLFGVMRGVAAGFKAAGITKVIEAGFKADASMAALLKASGAQLAEMVLSGGIGVLLAIVEAKVKQAMGSKAMTEAELDEMIRMNVAQTIIMTISGRLLASPMNALKVKAAFQGQKWKAAYGSWKAEKATIDALAAGKPAPEAVIAATMRDREQIQRELAALEELRATAESNPKALEDSGITAKDLDGQIGKLRGHDARMYGLQMTMALKEIAPNHFKAPRSQIGEILHTHGTLKSKIELEATDANTGARTWKITPVEPGSPAMRITEQMPAWALKPSGQRILYAARKAGMDDAAIFNLPEKTIAALEKAATSKSAVEARKAIKDADLDASVRDKLAAELEALRMALNPRRDPTGCFVAGTLVWTAEGPRAIETLAMTDRVIATDLATSVRHAEPILALFDRTADAVIELAIGATSIRCSAEHPFWVPGGGWTRADALRIGTRLTSVEGELLLDGVRVIPGEVTVYNLHVDGPHTYHVSPLGVLVHNKANAHRFFKQRNDLVAAIDAAVKAIDQMRGETTTTGELGKVDVTKRTDLAERLSKARDQLENTKASTKDLTLKDEDLLDLAKSEHSKASDEVATLQRDVAEAKKPFQQRMNELADGVSTLETRRADAATENDKMLADAEAAKTSAGDDKGQLEEATKQRAAALARKKTLEKTRQRIEAVKRDSNTISEDPSSDSGITAQKDRLNAAEIELANLEGEMSQGGHMLGSKGPQITSKTLWESDDGVQHVDIENPNPGQRPGQIHYQPDAYSKWYYDPHLKKLYNQKEKTLAPPSVQARLKDPEIAAAIEEGLRQLGETK